MSRTDTAGRVISASPDRVFAALSDPDALAGPAEGTPNGTPVCRLRSDTQCERPARRPSRAWFGRSASVSAGDPLAIASALRAEAPVRLAGCRPAVAIRVRGRLSPRHGDPELRRARPTSCAGVN